MLSVTSNLQQVLDALQEKINTSNVDTSDATATSSEILSSETAYVNNEKIIGTMPNNGAVHQQIDGVNTKSAIIPKGYTSGGSIGLDSTISAEADEQSELIAQIQHDVENLSFYASEENTLQATELLHNLIARSSITHNNPITTSIRNYAFYSYSNLTSISFPAATTIGSYAFYHCDSLTTINFPNVTTIDEYAFNNCYSLTTISFPKATTIGGSAFKSCPNLTTVSFPQVTTISSWAFNYCYKLTSSSFPKTTTIGEYAFYYCSSLTTASFPNVITIDNNAFQNCSKLTTISFPQAITIGREAFYSCSTLTTASFPKATTIGSGAFRYCYNLKALYLTGSSVCALANSSTFASTPIGGYSASAGAYGSIYVPGSLINTYRAATNWTYFSSRFVNYDGGEELPEQEPTIEQFTIEGNSYQFENGMTWSAWIVSAYNTGGYIEDEDGWGTLSIVLDYEYVVRGVAPTDFIVANQEYYHEIYWL